MLESLRLLESLPLKQVRVDDFVDGKFRLRKLLQFLGPGFLVSIAYIDPGNCLSLYLSWTLSLS